MVTKQNRGRARFKGDYLVPVKTNVLVEALEKRQEKEHVSQAELMAAMHLAPTFLSIMKGKKQASVFSTNLKRICDYLGEDMKTFIRGRTDKWLVPRIKPPLTSTAFEAPVRSGKAIEKEVNIVQGIVDLSSRIKHLPSVDREMATRLVYHLLAD